MRKVVEKGGIREAGNGTGTGTGTDGESSIHQ